MSEIVLAVGADCEGAWSEPVGTVGELSLPRRPRNVIPARSPHRRYPQPQRRNAEAIDRDLRSAIAEMDQGARPRSPRCDLAQPPTVFNPKLVDAVEKPPRRSATSHRRITSGAGHDACNLANVVPSAMIFFLQDGVSHNELEDATQADCTAAPTP